MKTYTLRTESGTPKVFVVVLSPGNLKCMHQGVPVWYASETLTKATELVITTEEHAPAYLTALKKERELIDWDNP